MEIQSPHYVFFPPPNQTGVLHCGHFLMSTIYDTIVRGMNIILNKKTYIAPGIDHGGIAMQVAARTYYKRTPTYDEICTLAKQYREGIENDLKKWNLSFDWSKNHYTMNDAHNKFVTDTFCKLYNAGYITQKRAMVNWDTGFNTAISDLEVEMISKKGYLYEIPYLTSLGDTLIVCTTRPETIFADACLMINPNDIEKQKYIGQYAYIPLINKQIPILSDEYVDMKYGSGVLKVTPGHDMNDYALGEKYKLPIYNILDDHSNMKWNELDLNNEQLLTANKCLYNGSSIESVRSTIVELLNCNKNEIIHNIPISSRSQAPVEYCLKIQWFMSMQEAASLALQANIELLPANQFVNNMRNWLINIHDWCLSRASPWGHTIPAWYKDDHMIVSDKCPEEGYVQTTEKLDTWFSSALWPLSYKNTFNIFDFDILVTGYDILFFWVARMIMMTLIIEKIDHPIDFDVNKYIPFRKVYLHGLVRDENNKKMSKTLNNVINPQAEIEFYTNEYKMNGLDLLRLSLLLQVAPNSNIKMRYNLLRARNIITKLTNCCNFLSIHSDDNNTTADIDLIKYFEGRLQYFQNKIIDLSQKTILHSVIEEIVNLLYEICDYLLEFYKVESGLYKIFKLSVQILLKCFYILIPNTVNKLYLTLFNEDIAPLQPLNYTSIEKTHDLILLIRQLRILQNLKVKYYYNQKYANIIRKLCINHCEYNKDLKSIILNKYIVHIYIENIDIINKYIQDKEKILNKIKITDNMPDNIKKEYNEIIININQEISILKDILR